MWRLLLGLALAVVGIVMMLWPHWASAGIPDAAKQFQRTLMRASHHGWGLDAPVATFAGQVHQESRWDVHARSPAGAQGIAQFMPGTSAWIVEVFPELGAAAPYNAGWSLRAMVAYNQWHWQRIRAATDCDRMAFALAAYNGGLGWVLRDKALASAKGADPLVYFNAVEAYNAGRSAANFRENRTYVDMILNRWQPLYLAAGWGRGVSCPVHPAPSC